MQKRYLTQALLWWVFCLVALLALWTRADARNLHRERVLPRFNLEAALGQSNVVINLDANDTATTSTDGAANFVAASRQTLSVADPDWITGDQDMSLVSYIFMDSQGAEVHATGAFTGTGNQRSYQIRYNTATDRWAFSVSANGISVATVTDPSFGAVPTGIWSCVIAQHDATNNLIGIKTDDGTLVTLSHSGGLFNSTGNFSIGATGDNAANWNGRVTMVAVFDKLLTAAEQTFLCGGPRRTCAEFSALPGLTTGMEECFDLFEGDGSRVGINGTVLVPTNSPGTAPGPDPLRVLDGAPLTIWAETSGQNNDLLQNTQLLKPKWIQNCQNGRACVQTDGIDDVMTTAAFASNLSQPNTYFTVYRLIGRVLSGHLHDGLSIANRSDVFFQASPAGIGLFSGLTVVTATPDYVPGDADLFVVTFDAARTQGSLNGIRGPTVNPGPSSVEGFHINSRFDGLDPGNIDFMQFLVLDGSIDFANLNRMTRCLKERWAIVPNTGYCK